jgi:hypothetical protein
MAEDLWVGGLLREHGLPGDRASRSRIILVAGDDVRVEVRNPVPEGEQVHGCGAGLGVTTLVGHAE